MAKTSTIREHMEVIGADGVHIGTVDQLEGKRIKLTKHDSGQGSHEGHHHYIATALVAEVEGDKVRLSAMPMLRSRSRKRRTGVPKGYQDRGGGVATRRPAADVSAAEV